MAGLPQQGQQFVIRSSGSNNTTSPGDFWYGGSNNITLETPSAGQDMNFVWTMYSGGDASWIPSSWTNPFQMYFGGSTNNCATSYKQQNNIYTTGCDSGYGTHVWTFYQTGTSPDGYPTGALQTVSNLNNGNYYAQPSMYNQPNLQNLSTNSFHWDIIPYSQFQLMMCCGYGMQGWCPNSPNDSQRSTTCDAFMQSLCANSEWSSSDRCSCINAPPISNVITNPAVAAAMEAAGMGDAPNCYYPKCMSSGGYIPSSASQCRTSITVCESKISSVELSTIKSQLQNLNITAVNQCSGSSSSSSSSQQQQNQPTSSPSSSQQQQPSSQQQQSSSQQTQTQPSSSGNNNNTSGNNNNTSTSSSTTTTYVIVGIIGAVALLAIIVAVVIVIRHRRRREQSQWMREREFEMTEPLTQPLRGLSMRQVQ